MTIVRMTDLNLAGKRVLIRQGEPDAANCPIGSLRRRASGQGRPGRWFRSLPGHAMDGGRLDQDRDGLKS